MSPTDQVFVLTPPPGFLILGIADDSGGSELSDGNVLHGSRLSAGEHDFSFHILRGVVRILSPRADINQLRSYISGLAVFGQNDGHRGVAGELRDRLRIS